MKRPANFSEVLRRNLFTGATLATLFALVALVIPTHAFAQAINFDLGQGPTTTSKMVQIVLLITVLSLAPSILVMVTSFTRIVVVLSFMRTALGLQTTPPNVVLTSLALFLTLFIMQPTFDQAWETGIKPMMDNQLDEETAITRTIEPFHDFMMKHTRQKDIDLFIEMGKPDGKTDSTSKPAANATASPLTAQDKSSGKNVAATHEDVQLRALIPAFMISELRRAFEIGFLLFLPFLIIDMVVASILMSMGMMMLPPSIISLPFKIIFFVLVDGWYLISGSMIQSYGS
ncbi:MAG: flagellar type III secretion system pore protein FliP [Pseudomonadota bacterium]|nr:flagellar type III secretion system pore protein FliP [Pseudomonadota bacterium]